MFLKCLIFIDFCVVFQNLTQNCTGRHTVLDIVVLLVTTRWQTQNTERNVVRTEVLMSERKKMSDLIRKGHNLCPSN